jgi:type II secretion system protein C
MKTQYFKFMLPIACLIFLAASAPAKARTSVDESKPPAVPESSHEAYNQSSTGDEVLDFRLLGIAVSADLDQTLAIIQEGADSRQKFIHEGDSIGEVVVKKILRDQVIFDTGRGEHIITLKRIYLDGGSPGGTLMSGQPVSNYQPLSSKKQIVEVESAKLSASLADINKVVRRVNLNPVAVYGRPIGIRISPIEPGGIFAELGLKTGDIITAVNGETIKKPEEAIALLERIREGGEFDINIEGSRHTRKFQLIVK